MHSFEEEGLLSRTIVEALGRVFGEKKTSSTDGRPHLEVARTLKPVRRRLNLKTAGGSPPLDSIQLPRSNSWGQFVAFDHRGDVDDMAKPINFGRSEQHDHDLRICNEQGSSKTQCAASVSSALDMEERNWRKWRRDFARSLFSCRLSCNSNYSEVRYPFFIVSFCDIFRNRSPPRTHTTHTRRLR